MAISIYPPTLQSTQPAFLNTISEYIIYFNLQSITSYSDIGHVQVRIVRQLTNQTIVNTQKYPDGIIYKSYSDIKWLDSNRTKGSISVYRKDDLAEYWEPDCVYKVQMRFGTSKQLFGANNFAVWKQQQIDEQAFSEWSTVMIIKAISKPNVIIQNAEAISSSEITSSERREATLTPLFIGKCTWKNGKELVEQYRFSLYSGDDFNDASKLVETSGWLRHDSSQQVRTDTHRFKTVLISGNIYTLKYEIKTVNGYIDMAEPYTFSALQTYFAELENVELRVEDDTPYCKDNGCINIYLTAGVELSGAYVLTRSSQKTNYQVWENLKYFAYPSQTFQDKLIYQDFTIESGVGYKYAFQMENAAGLRTSPIYAKNNAAHSVDFEYSYLYRDGVQLRLQFNQKINSFKHTVLTSKQDTLGDKYPHLVKNGNAYYAEFPISGLISLHMDQDNTFMKVDTNGLIHDGELVIPRDKLQESLKRESCQKDTDTSYVSGTIEDKNSFVIDNSLSDNNFYAERKFREKVEEFLNNFEYKLYRSPSEGNMVIGLMNVTLTPNATLNRMIFEFSATAYEVLENTLENLNEIGVIDIGQFSTLANDDVFYTSFGQIRGVYTPAYPQIPSIPIDTYAMIKEQEEISLGGGYKMRLEYLTSFWIERYPIEDFKEELMELQAHKAQLQIKGEDTSEVDALIIQHEGLQQAMAGPSDTTITLIVNGQRVLVFPNRIYSLREPVTSLQVASAVSPIIINYVCKTTQQEDLSVGVVSAIDASKIWGQISGVFTGTDKILKTYNFDYGPGQLPYRVYNNRPDGTVVYDKFGNILVDNTNFNVYKTINIYEIIKEDTRHQVEFIYEIKDGFYQDENGDWTDGTIYYSFSDIIEFDIEADPGTLLYIGKSVDGSDAVEMIIGPTGRYILNPMESLVKYIALKEPQFAIINYKCLTNQMKMQKKG